MTSPASQANPEPTEQDLEEAIRRARQRFSSEGSMEFREFEKDFAPAAQVVGEDFSATAAKLEAMTGVKDLSDEEHEEVRRREEEALRREWEEERQRARMERLLEKSELPATYSRFLFSTFDAAGSRSASEAASAAMEYAAHFDEHAKEGKGLVLSGPVGVGKSHLAVALMQTVVERHRVAALFVTVPGMLESERRSYDSFSGAGAGSLEAAKDADLLILDDLGAERPTEWVHEKLFYLVNHRYAQGLPIVATTNLSVAAAAERVGPRSVSRLVETCQWVGVEGEDYRLRRMTK